jgi:hypothetical protein
MRRLLTALVLVPLLALAGCGAVGPVDIGRAMLDTSWMCDALNEVLANSGRTLGHELGDLAGQQKSGDPAAASSRAAALGTLASLARELRTTVRASNDPVLSAAVTQVADNLGQLALDESLVLAVRSGADLAAAVRVIAAALAPLSAICE